jgi:hypothetical protein
VTQVLFHKRSHVDRLGPTKGGLRREEPTQRILGGSSCGKEKTLIFRQVCVQAMIFRRATLDERARACLQFVLSTRKAKFHKHRLVNPFRPIRAQNELCLTITPSKQVVSMTNAR